MNNLVGLVGYKDDLGVFFRVVYPQEGDPPDILNDPKWITEGCDKARIAVLIPVAPNDPRIQMIYGGTNTDNGIVVSLDGD